MDRGLVRQSKVKCDSKERNLLLLNMIIFGGMCINRFQNSLLLTTDIYLKLKFETLFSLCIFQALYVFLVKNYKDQQMLNHIKILTHIVMSNLTEITRGHPESLKTS